MANKNIALVMGGTGGIGSAISKAFSDSDIKVYATYRKNRQKAQALENTLKNFNAIQCNVRDEKSTERMVKIISEKETRINILVNSITTSLKLKPFEMFTEEEFREDMETIFFGSLSVLKKIIPMMKKNRSGVIINILTGAIVGHSPSRMPSYITAKSALWGLTRSLAVELKRFNIKVIGLSPSFVETDLIKAFPPKLLEIERERQPNKKLIQPDEIAKLVLNIAQSPNDYQNADNITIDTREDIAKLI